MVSSFEALQAQRLDPDPGGSSPFRISLLDHHQTPEAVDSWSQAAGPGEVLHLHVQNPGVARLPFILKTTNQSAGEPS